MTKFDVRSLERYKAVNTAVGPKKPASLIHFDHRKTALVVSCLSGSLPNNLMDFIHFLMFQLE